LGKGLTTANDSCYMWIIQDTQCNGATASAAEVWKNTDLNPSSCLRNVQNGDRFKVLAKRKITLNSGASDGAGTYSGDNATDEGFIKCNIPVSFNGATGAITEVKSNNILIYFGAAFADDISTVQGQFRVRFSDL